MTQFFWTIDLAYLYFSWVISCIASLGSIIFGELQHNFPCILCWVQRIFLFPLTYILGVAFIKKNAHIFPYVALLPLLGIFVSGYHIAVQEIPSLEPVKICGMGPSCAYKFDIGLGFVTIPMLACLCFVLIFFLLLLAYKHAKKYTPNPIPPVKNEFTDRKS